MTGRLPALVAGLLALVACQADEPPVACPAVAWSTTVIVELAADWPALDGGSVQLECSPACSLEVRLDEDPAPLRELSLPLVGSSVEFGLLMNAPESAVVTVLGADGTRLAEVEEELDWVRVGGSAECGGPMQTTVEVPAP